MMTRHSTTGLYAKLAFTRRGKPGGALPDTELELTDARADRSGLVDYARICGFPIGNDLPVTYPHILAFPLTLRLLADPDFPFPAMGLVHIRNRIEQRRRLDIAEPLSFRARLDQLTPHRRGTQFDVEVVAEADGEPVWIGRSSYLYKDNRATVEAAPRDEGADRTVPPTVGRWRVPADTGRRYAAVSGDPNPIHLHPLTARLFGSRRPIAHGMWSKARCLAAFQGRLPDAFSVDTTFVKPVPLPSTVEFAVRSPDNERWEFELRSPDASRLHLTGTVRPL
jgi:acyl dehydratase